MADSDMSEPNLPDDGRSDYQHGMPSRRTTRRQLLLAGAGTAAGLALGQWLAACGDATALHTPAPTATLASTATSDTRPATVVVTGDIMLARSVNTALLASHDRFPFNDTADYLRSFDLTIGNLECVVSSLGSPQPKEFTFEANPRAFERLPLAGYGVLSVANNHSGDFGKTAFMDMLGHLPAFGIMPLGGGANLVAAHQPVIRTIRTTTIGILAYCEIDPFNFAATASEPGHAWLDPTLIRADIQALRPKVDFILVFTHWGIEYQPQETGHQQAMARLAIDAGADVVVGAHPHIIQPYELYNGKLIVYSLGNFVFDGMYEEVVRRGSILTLTLKKNQLLAWKLVTSRIGDWGEPKLLEG